MHRPLPLALRDIALLLQEAIESAQRARASDHRRTRAWGWQLTHAIDEAPVSVVEVNGHPALQFHLPLGSLMWWPEKYGQIEFEIVREDEAHEVPDRRDPDLEGASPDEDLPPG